MNRNEKRVVDLLKQNSETNHIVDLGPGAGYVLYICDGPVYRSYPHSYVSAKTMLRLVEGGYLIPSKRIGYFPMWQLNEEKI